MTHPNPTPTGWLARERSAVPTGRAPVALQAHEPRRRHTRYGTRHLQIDSPARGYVVNFSETGLCFDTPAKLLDGAGYVFRLSYGSRFLHLPGRVIWSRLERSQRTRRGVVQVFRTGIELAAGEPTDDWRRLIGELTGTSIVS